jgi:hypothetical protein
VACSSLGLSSRNIWKNSVNMPVPLDLSVISLGPFAGSTVTFTFNYAIWLLIPEFTTSQGWLEPDVG